MAEDSGQELTFPQITHPKKRAYLAAFAKLGAEIKACRVAKIDRKTAYNWKTAVLSTGRLR